MLRIDGPGKVVLEAATSSLEEDSSPRQGLKIHPRTSSFVSSSSMWSNGTDQNFSLSLHGSNFTARNKPLYGLEYKQDKVVVKTLTRDERRKSEDDSEIYSESSSLSSVEKERPGAYRRKRMVEQRRKLDRFRCGSENESVKKVYEREPTDDNENNSNGSFPSIEDSDTNEATYLLSLPLTISRSVSSLDLTAISSSKSKKTAKRRHGVSSGRIREAKRLEESMKSQFRKIRDLLDEDVSSDSLNEDDAKGGSTLIDYAEYGLYVPPASDTDPDEPYIEVEKK